MNSVSNFILSWVGEKTGTRPEPHLDFFRDPAFDSLAFAQLISAIEDEFDISISFANITDWQDVTSTIGLANFILKSNG